MSTNRRRRRHRRRMSNFDERLTKAVQRGHTRSTDRAKVERAKQLSEEELKNFHTKYRLQFSEQIERCVRQLPEHFPGFQCETLFGDRGWGAACSRDDLGPGGSGKRASFYSRLEMSIRPFSTLNVVELTAKGTIRNKEIYSRNHFELIHDVDPDMFITLIDAWVLEYAEQYAAS